MIWQRAGGFGQANPKDQATTQTGPEATEQAGVGSIADDNRSNLFLISLRNLRIFQKILIIPVMAAAITLGIGVAALWMVASFNQVFQETVNINVVKNDISGEILGDLMAAHSVLHRALSYSAIGETKARVREVAAGFERNLFSVALNLERLRTGFPLNTEESGMLAEIHAMLAEARDDGGSVTDFLGIDLVAAASFLRTYDNTFERLATLVRRFTDVQRRQVAERQAALHHQEVTAETVLGLGTLIILAVFAAVAGVVVRVISGPVVALTGIMTRLAEGDLRIGIPATERRDEIGAMARAVSVFKDNAIARRRAEHECEVEERRWRSILEESPVGISILAMDDHQRLYTNPGYDALFGFAVHSAALTRPIAQSFVNPDDADRLFDLFSRDGAVSSLELRRRRADGSIWWSLHDVRLIDFMNRPAYIVWHYDVTFRHEAEQNHRVAKERAEVEKERAEAALAELRATQHSLIEAEKMASLGGLVAGIAHEINTPVGITLTAGSMLADTTLEIKAKVESGTLRKSEFNRYLAVAVETSQQIVSNSLRAAELIQSFKQVAVDQTSDGRRPVNLGHYLSEILISLGPRLRKTAVKVTIDCPDKLMLDTWPGPLAQVVTNFVMNSLIHAFPDGRSGLISITVSVTPDNAVQMVYADDGDGIAPEYLSKIFDPFFTTNRVGGGTGLGLHIVYNIVQQKLKGKITVESTLGHGTAFTIIFPK
ncbi:hypothetical protein WCLP8_4980002 [uncultured Gammaproteobacteria bacterium]